MSQVIVTCCYNQILFWLIHRLDCTPRFLVCNMLNQYILIMINTNHYIYLYICVCVRKYVDVVKVVSNDKVLKKTFAGPHPNYIIR